MSENKKSVKQLPYPTTGRLHHVPYSTHHAKMDSPGGPHLVMRESERELLYRIMSKLFPDPDNQPDWFKSHIPIAMIVASGYAPSGFTADPRQLSGFAPYGIERLNICLFYNKYVVRRMEGRMSKRFLPREFLSEKERDRLDFAIQTMIRLLPDGWPLGVGHKEFMTKFATQCNEAGAREVDGKRFTPFSAELFHGRVVADARGWPTNYDKYCTQDYRELGVEKELVDQLVSGEIVRLVADTKEGEDGTTAVNTQVNAREVDNKLVEQAVAFINEKANEALYKYSIEIGNYILERFFAGNIEAAASKHPKKVTSYRALCQHPDLAPNPGALSVMLRVAVQEKLFEAKKLPVDKLSYSHKAELVSIPDDETKIRLFKEAVKKSLSVRDLRDRVAQEKGLLPPGQSIQTTGDRPRAIDFEKLLSKPIFHDTEKLKGLNAKKRRKLQDKVEEAYTRLARLLDEYSKLRTLLSEIEEDGEE